MRGYMLGREETEDPIDGKSGDEIRRHVPDHLFRIESVKGRRVSKLSK